MKLYNDYGAYLKERYGTKVYRIGIDAGFSCPGRCLYCNANGSRASYTDPKKPVRDQIKTRIDYLKDAKGAVKFIAYFQAFTNTYAPAERLKATYDEALPFKEIVGISIGTRPDAVDEEKLALISSYKKRYEVWIEYGLQSSHDKTLDYISRGHTFSDFVNAVKRSKELGISVCAHVIIGLPGETRNDIIGTARKLSELKIDGVKIHLLHILKGSALEKLYNEGKVTVLEQDEYAELVCDFLENLSKDILIQRLTGEGRGESHIAPLWALDKTGTINKIIEKMEERPSRQGLYFSAVP